MMQTFEELDTVTDRANAGLQTLAAQPEVNSEKNCRCRLLLWW